MRICQVGLGCPGSCVIWVYPSEASGMRHFPRLNRVAYGILGRWHPRVLTLLEQNAGFRRDLGRRAPPAIYCASVSPNLRCVSAIVRRTPASVSDNVRRKWPSIARRAVYYCAPLHLRDGRPACRRRPTIRPGARNSASMRWRGSGCKSVAGSSLCVTGMELCLQYFRYLSSTDDAVTKRRPYRPETRYMRA